MMIKEISKQAYILTRPQAPQPYTQEEYEKALRGHVNIHNEIETVKRYLLEKQKRKKEIR